MIKGLATTTYCVPDMNAAKEWYSKAFKTEPYFDQPFYMGFNIKGFELGLLPQQEGESPGAGGVTSYWRVLDLDAEIKHFESLGAKVKCPKQDVGEGILLATLLDPFDNVIGLIYNPHFALED